MRFFVSSGGVLKSDPKDLPFFMLIEIQAVSWNFAGFHYENGEMATALEPLFVTIPDRADRVRGRRPPSARRGGR